MSPALAEIREYLNSALKEELRTVLKSDYVDPKYLEVTTAQAIVERISSWAKIFGGVVAVPLAAAVIVLGSLGLKSYSDFTSELKTAQQEIEGKLKASQAVATQLQTDGATLSAKYKEISQQLEETTNLAQKVSRLDKKVTGIADSLKKVLSVGNSRYLSIPSLSSPENDATDVAHAFTSLGYRSTLITNASQKAMLEGVHAFVSSLSAGDTVVFFYSGHGISVNGTNYLVPIDSTEELTERAITRISVKFDDILQEFEQSNARAVIIILDTCRDNPFVSNSRGLDNIIVRDPPPGIFILFSASPGEIALDRADKLDGGRNSPFTHFLISELDHKNLSIVDMAHEIRTAVAGFAAASGIKQQPAFVDQTDGPIFLAGRM